MQKPFSGQDVIHPISLHFRQPELEKEYCLFNSKQSLPLIRVAVLMSIFIHLMYLPLDEYILGKNHITLWRIRLFFLIPISILLYLLTFSKWYSTYGMDFSKFMIIMNGLVMSCSPLFFGIESLMYFVPGTVMVIMYGFILLGINFASGVIIAWLLVASNIIVIYITVPISPLMFNALEVLNISTIILTIGSYQYEKISKFSYFQSKQLIESEKQKHEMEMSHIVWFEQMAHFLRHELHNVVIGVEKSLEAYVYFTTDQSENKYIIRSQNGLYRIREILDSVSKASSIETSLLRDSSPIKEINICELLREQIENYRSIFPHNQFILKFDDTINIVKGKMERLVQMLDKIISNAVDHSPENGPILIILTVEQKQISIAIRNQGSPLPDNKERLFDLFFSLKKSTSPNNHHGYGLYISKQIALNHNGKIEASNLPDNTGVEFIVTLPIL